jgi:hypothetical protein
MISSNYIFLLLCYFTSVFGLINFWGNVFRGKIMLSLYTIFHCLANKFEKFLKWMTFLLGTKMSEFHELLSKLNLKCVWMRGVN